MSLRVVDPMMLAAVFVALDVSDAVCEDVHDGVYAPVARTLKLEAASAISSATSSALTRGPDGW
jgi:hypothetical protein